MKSIEDTLRNLLRKLVCCALCYGASLTLIGANMVQAQENASEEMVRVETNPEFFVPVTTPETVEADSSELTQEAEFPWRTMIQTGNDSFASATIGEDFTKVVTPEEDNSPLRVNDEGTGEEVEVLIINGVTYVPLLAMSQILDHSAVCTWNAEEQIATVTSETLNLTAVGNQLYLEANGRFLYIANTLQLLEDDLLLPLSTLTRAFDAELLWDEENSVISVNTGTGGILSGDEFYNQDDLFWLSRVIFAESGNQPLEGQMGVAMVIYNRIADPWYPSTVQGVLAQKNQFSTYQNGGLANRTPNASSILAAKLVMDGGVVKEIANATHFDSISGSWASKNLSTILVIGGHTFYG